MDKTNVKITFYVGILVALCVGIVLFVSILSLVIKSIPSTHSEGLAADADIIKFNEYYRDFSLVANFALEKYKELPHVDESRGGRTFFAEVDSGYVMHQSQIANSQGSYDDVPFKGNETIQQSVKKFKEYFGENTLRINVVEDKVLFIYGRIRVIYTSDNSIPKFTYHPRELVPSYTVHKLCDNWYIAENTTPYPGN